MKYNLKEIQKRAKNINADVWESGGYYYLSGFLRGQQRQGIFSNLEQINRQLVFEEKYN